MTYKLKTLKNLALFTSLSTVLLNSGDVMASSTKSTSPIKDSFKSVWNYMSPSNSLSKNSNREIELSSMTSGGYSTPGRSSTSALTPDNGRSRTTTTSSSSEFRTPDNINRSLIGNPGDFPRINGGGDFTFPDSERSSQHHNSFANPMNALPVANDTSSTDHDVTFEYNFADRSSAFYYFIANRMQETHQLSQAGEEVVLNFPVVHGTNLERIEATPTTINPQLSSATHSTTNQPITLNAPVNNPSAKASGSTQVRLPSVVNILRGAVMASMIHLGSAPTSAAAASTGTGLNLIGSNLNSEITFVKGGVLDMSQLHGQENIESFASGTSIFNIKGGEVTGPYASSELVDSNLFVNSRSAEGQGLSMLPSYFQPGEVTYLDPSKKDGSTITVDTEGDVIPSLVPTPTEASTETPTSSAPGAEFLVISPTASAYVTPTASVGGSPSVSEFVTPTSSEPTSGTNTPITLDAKLSTNETLEKVADKLQVLVKNDTSNGTVPTPTSTSTVTPGSVSSIISSNAPANTNSTVNGTVPTVTPVVTPVVTPAPVPGLAPAPAPVPDPEPEPKPTDESGSGDKKSDKGESTKTDDFGRFVAQTAAVAGVLYYNRVVNDKVYDDEDEEEVTEEKTKTASTVVSSDKAITPAPAPVVKNKSIDHYFDDHAINKMSDAERRSALDKILADHPHHIEKSKQFSRQTTNTSKIGAMLAHSAIRNRMNDFGMEIGVGAGSEKVSGILNNVWATAMYGQTKDRTHGSSHNASVYGPTIGVDLNINENNIVGVAYSNVVSNFKFSSSKGKKINAETHIFSVYGQSKLSDNIVWNNLASFSASKVNSKRAGLVDTSLTNEAIGKYSDKSQVFETSLNYNQGISENVSIVPNAGLRFTNYVQSAHKEAGVGLHNLEVASKSEFKTVGILGARMIMSKDLGKGMEIMPSLDFGIEDHFNNKSKNAKTKFAYNDKYFESTYSKVAKIQYNLGAGVTLRKDSVELSLSYNANLYTKYENHQGSLKLKVMF
jgi:hypothetical protein